MEKEIKRAIIFIDGNNFYYKMKEMTSGMPEILKLLDFQYSLFSKNLVKENELIEIRYYIGAVRRQPNGDKNRSEKLYSDQQKLIGKLQQQNISVVLGNLIQHPDKTFHEKGVDVRIAVEMIRFARENKYDIAYLLSSDTDLVPAVEEVRSFNKEVTYTGIAKGQSFGLTKVSNNTILLRKEDFLPYIPLVHEMKLQPLPFEQIKSKTKTIEVRLNDEKRQKIKVGDDIDFSNTENKDKIIKTKVLGIVYNKNFSDLFDTFPATVFGGKDKEDLMGIYKYYSKEDEEKFGVVGIKLEYIK